VRKFKDWLKGKDRKENLENISFVILTLAALLIVTGLVFGSFIHGAVLFAMFGAFLILIGIIVYIASEFLKI